MNKCTVTIKKDFELNGHKCFSGNFMEIYVGSNVSQEKFDELLERGFIELGKNVEFMNEKGTENSNLNKEVRHESD